jgi:hypothetical protein
MAIIPDYYQMPKVPHDIDPMGFGGSIERNNPKAGSQNSPIGFSSLKRFQQQKAMAVGANVGMKNVINWMQNVGLEVNNNRIKNINDVTKENANDINAPHAIGILARMANINQSMVDQWGGSNDILFTNARNFYLFGEVPAGMEINPTNYRMNLESMFSGHTLSAHGGTSINASKKSVSIDRDIVGIIANTMRRASMIFNDTYDAGGRHTPENWELSKVQSDLRYMFSSPDKYVVQKLLWQHRKDRGMQNAIVKKFYDSGSMSQWFRVGDNRGVAYILNSIRKGNIPDPTAEVVKFRTTPAEKDIHTGQRIRPADFYMGLNNSGYLINQVLENNAFGTQNRFGSLRKDRVSDVVKFSSNLIDRVAFLQAFGHNVTEPIELMDQSGNLVRENFDIGYKDGLGRGYKGARRVELEGAVYHMLERESARLGRNIMKYKAGGKFMQFDLQMAAERQASIEATMNIVEKNAMSDLKPVDINVHKVKTAKGFTPKKKFRKLNRDMYVYSFRGDIPFDKQKMGEFNYKELNDEIGYVKAGDGYVAKPGVTYLEIKRPIIQRSISSEEARAGYSLWKATNDANPARYLGEIQTNNFMEHTAVVQKEISDNYNDVLSQLKAAGNQGTAYSGELWGKASTKDQWILDAYFKRFAGQDLSKQDELLMAVKMLIRPRPLMGKYLLTKNEVPGLKDIPMLGVNKRLLSSTFEWLSRNGYLEVDGRGFPNETLPGLQKIFSDWTKYEKQMKNGKDWEFEDINRTIESKNLMFMNDYSANLQKLGDKGNISLVSSMLSDLHYYDPAMENMLNSMDLLPSGRQLSKFTADPIKAEKIKVELKDKGCRK